MPISKYLIRNEYSLADPELYRAADKDDPEALLEAVAMAGLVGLLRQLGDLAELVFFISCSLIVDSDSDLEFFFLVELVTILEKDCRIFEVFDGGRLIWIFLLLDLVTVWLDYELEEYKDGEFGG